MEKERETLKNEQKIPFLVEKQCFSIKTKKGKEPKKKQTNKKSQPKKQIRRV